MNIKVLEYLGGHPVHRMSYFDEQVFIVTSMTAKINYELKKKKN
jgi:hypothetical protein